MRHLLLAVVLLFAFSLRGQQQLTHEISPFRGTIYEMPKYSETKGLKAGIENFDSIGQIVLPKLNLVPEFPDEQFPDYQLNSRFAFTLSATLNVFTEGCYHAKLASDDGSLLWIDEELSVDNDGMHTWKIARDTLHLAAGLHDVKLWYYNAIGPTGLAFRLDLTDSTYCSPPVEEVVACISFAEDEYTLDDTQENTIKEFMGKIASEVVYDISITGYANSKGSSNYNEVLSVNRSNAVGDYLSELLEVPKDSFGIIGKGETELLKNGINGCGSNRAVVLKLTPK